MDSERATQAKLFIEEFYFETFSLDNVAQHVGCSSSYLSRTFSKETGMTLKNYLRTVRVRKAKKMLLSGRYNVTEAAFECGYNSLSHFTKAFKEVLGYKPSELKFTSKP